MIAVQVELPELPGIRAAWARAPDIVAEELLAGVLEAELLLEREVKDRTPTGATGLLRESISARPPQRLADRIVGEVGTAIRHAIPVELGTRPHMPPVAPIEDWVRAKLGVPSEEVRGVAWAIARKIAARGTKGARMFERAFQANERQVQTIMEAAAARVAQRLAP